MAAGAFLTVLAASAIAIPIAIPILIPIAILIAIPIPIPIPIGISQHGQRGHEFAFRTAET